MSRQKQPLNVYFVMLIASTLLMLAACILMFIEAYRYGSPWEKTGLPSRVMAPSQSATLA